jgi:tetratricopeptide (TPR) repeat protein
MRVGRFDEAMSIFEEVLKIKPDFPFLGIKLGYCHALQEDYPESLRWIDYHIAVSGSKLWKGGGYMMRGMIDYMVGNEDRSLEDFQAAAELAGDVDNTFWRICSEWAKGWVHYERGEVAAAHACFLPPLDSLEEFQLSIPQHPPVMDYRHYRAFARGMLAVRERDFVTAKARLTDLESFSSAVHPQYMNLAVIQQNMLAAEILIAEVDYKRAVEILEESPRWEIPRFVPAFIMPYSSPYIKDILARLYEQIGEHEKAITEYEWLTTVGPQRELCPLIHPLYHYRLALLYERTGRSKLAVERYERFLDTWIHAAAGRPEIVDAKARLARLQGEGAN